MRRRSLMIVAVCLGSLAAIGITGCSSSNTSGGSPNSGGMMGGGGCASCHGADGRGGTIKMMTGTVIKAPDVTHGALVKSGFTDVTIGRAVRDGLDESGQPLDEAMPRWQMSNTDLAATIAYLKGLSTR
jgi:mono/diheme cytochrome c family protein